MPGKFFDQFEIGEVIAHPITRTVTEYLGRHPVPVTVVDPVMVATSGDRLLTEDAEAALRDLCRTVDVITPNLAELAALGGTTTATTHRTPPTRPGTTHDPLARDPPPHR